LAGNNVDPQFKAQTSKLINGLKQAVTWYEEGKLKPVITATVPFDAAALQQAFDAHMKGMNNMGKVVVKCNRHLAQPSRLLTAAAPTTEPDSGMLSPRSSALRLFGSSALRLFGSLPDTYLAAPQHDRRVGAPDLTRSAVWSAPNG
jgi:hypothetical protein